ncbi:MAG: lipopolysaccharide kinase InaA family protein [Prolixibacteraceae bacterium]
MMSKKIQFKVAPGYEVLGNWVKNLPEYFGANGTTIYKDRNEVKIFEEFGFKVNVKSFKVPILINQYIYVYLRGSKAARSYQNALRFMAVGASTPAPVAYVECLSMGKLKESFYVSLNFEHGFTLWDVFLNNDPDKENIIKQWVHFTWSRLHRNGIYHLDYSPGNTLIRKEANEYHFSIVDLNRMKFIPVDFEKGIQNFSQLDTDEETLSLIAREYAFLCGRSAEKAVKLLLKFDKDNKDYRRRKGNIKSWFRGKKG